MTKISNRDASIHVRNKEEFTGNNTFGRWVDDDNYVVFSYGEHFPMFAYKKDFGWCAQTSKYVYKNDDGDDVISRSTSKHYNQLHPLQDHVIVAGVSELRDFIRKDVSIVWNEFIRKGGV